MNWPDASLGRQAIGSEARICGLFASEAESAKLSTLSSANYENEGTRTARCVTVERWAGPLIEHGSGSSVRPLPALCGFCRPRRRRVRGGRLGVVCRRAGWGSGDGRALRWKATAACQARRTMAGRLLTAHDPRRCRRGRRCGACRG